jgi:hypothetical protein
MTEPAKRAETVRFALETSPVIDGHIDWACECLLRRGYSVGGLERGLSTDIDIERPRAGVATLMREVALKNGASLLFISHDLSVVRVIAGRVAVMQADRIVEEGPIAEVWDHPSNACTQRLLAAIPLADVLGTLPAARMIAASATA